MAANNDNAKQQQLGHYRVNRASGYLTTQQGVRVDHTDDALTAGERGPTLLEDFHAREKLTHFDHERIPERVVHARGAGAYGYFEPYDDSLSEYTVAKFLTTPGKQTPVFVRFSTVAGSRGSADTVRDVRGFATKFYTDQGNYDLVGNNMPVFFIQDGIKFPDFVHAVKPEPHNEIPQASSAHDTLWDFVSLQDETLHMIMWLMSDRALPRSYRMMQGFGVHTFRLVNARGEGTFVKFHWKPRLGVHSLIWDECQKIAGKDPDYNRRDLWEAIEAGQYPEYELGVQLIPERDEFSFQFDLLDATKIIPEEQVPVRPVGKMVLDRNPDNFFAETEQVAFHTANVVPGIDFTNDPLLQFRNFSYLDTQLIRLGGPNFAQLPVNRPVVDVRNNQHDGYGQIAIPQGKASYFKNSLGGGCPALADEDVFRHYTEKIDGHKIRQRAKSFQDHYSQARMFWKSMSAVEAEHIVAAFAFELGKVQVREIRARVVDQLNLVDHDLAARVAVKLGLPVPDEQPVDDKMPASPALSQLNTAAEGIQTRKIAVLAANGVDVRGTDRLLRAMRQRGAVPEVLAPVGGGSLAGGAGGDLAVDRAITTVASVLYDAVIVPCGPESVAALSDDGYAVNFVTEAYKHLKPVGAFGTGIELLRKAGVAEQLADGPDVVSSLGVVSTTAAEDSMPDEFFDAFASALAKHRAWDRDTAMVPA
ncbi:catalase [Mycobacterium heckeshornense]|uniref:Catalase n=1 Tax=Mycobacterium heckeshornense TaxID=110505 RepID=A0A2G8B890_9MYCO|nr:catalase [Mycobacterium heckeshornense]KMV22164.1 hydroperoxidase [Mycobacterium heckeshornense]MCV7033236.1 catalase [Mycobacterium heckeshornense]PIJ33993.1 catalase [Mycobacterium heckeshornense]BCO37373.1 catalase [Mycobacterium heckeshornense]